MNRSTLFIALMTTLASTAIFAGESMTELDELKTQSLHEERTESLLGRTERSRCSKKTILAHVIGWSVVATGLTTGLYYTIQPLLSPDPTTQPEQRGDGCHFIETRWCEDGGCTYATLWPVCPGLNISSPEIVGACQPPREVEFGYAKTWCNKTDHCYSHQQVKRILPKVCAKMTPPSKTTSEPTKLTPLQKIRIKRAALNAIRTGNV